MQKTRPMPALGACVTEFCLSGFISTVANNGCGKILTYQAESRKKIICKRILSVFPRIILGFVVVIGGIQHAKAMPYTVIEIVDVSGGPYHITANVINNLGQVVGNVSVEQQLDQGFIWENGAITFLDPLQDHTGSGRASASNDNGVIVGLTTGNPNYQGPGYLGTSTRWDNGVATALVEPPEYFYATSINKLDQITGESSFNEPILWNDGSIIPLGLLPDGDIGLSTCVNNPGQVVGFSRDIDVLGNPDRAFLWDNGVMQDIGQLLGRPSGSASAINDHSQIVGSFQEDGFSFFNAHAFLWANGNMKDLGYLPIPGDMRYSFARDINNLGVIVGVSNGRAVLWAPLIDAIYDLNDQIMPIDDVVLTRSYSINDLGQITVTGRGEGGFGDFRAFVLTPTGEPLINPMIAGGRIDIEKLTNGNQADSANDDDVPRIAPGETVSWTYLVTNIGEVDISWAEIVVTDSQAGVTPALDTTSDIGNDMYLSPGETWTYTASVQALVLETPPEGITVVPGCGDGRNTYQNTGRVEIANINTSDEDPSHYCNIGVADIDIRIMAEGSDIQTFPANSWPSVDIEVTNTGTITLNDIYVNEGYGDNCDKYLESLLAGESFRYTCSLPDVTGNLDTEACVEAYSTYQNFLSVEDCDPISIEIIDVDIRMQAEGADTRNFPYASNVPFEIVVTNTGDEDLVNVTISDPVAPNCSNDIGNLAAGGSVSYTCIQSAVTMDFTHLACVTADRNGVTVEDCDTSTVVMGGEATGTADNIANGSGGGGGCTINNKSHIDPVWPLLLMIPGIVLMRKRATNNTPFRIQAT